MSEAQGVEVNEKYKLRLYTASDISDYDDARLEESESGKIDCTRVYIQKDADEVFSKLEKEIERLKVYESNANWETDLDKLEYGDDIIAILNLSVNPIRLTYTGKTTRIVDDTTKKVQTFTDAFGKPFRTEIFKIILYTKYPKINKGDNNEVVNG